MSELEKTELSIIDLQEVKEITDEIYRLETRLAEIYHLQREPINSSEAGA